MLADIPLPPEISHASPTKCLACIMDLLHRKFLIALVAGSQPIKSETRRLGPDATWYGDLIRASHSILRGFPNLIENLGSQCGFVLRQKATVVLLNDIGRILNCVAGLLVGSGLLQNMRRENVRRLCGPCGSRPLIAPRPV